MSGEAEEKGVMPIRQPVTPETEGHVCEICGGPDHRACGCEARAMENAILNELQKPAAKLMHFSDIAGKTLTVCGTEIDAEKDNWTVIAGLVTCPKCQEWIKNNATADIQEVLKAGLKAGAEAADEAMSQIIENRDAMLAAQRDIVEQLKSIAQSLNVLVVAKKTPSQSLN